MKWPSSLFRLYAITDSRLAAESPLEEQVEKALRAGVTLLQLREKALSEEQLLERALCMRKITERFHVPLIINDNVAVALRCGADGVHLGQEDMDPREARRLLGPDKLLGVTAKTVEQARRAEAAGADYLGSGAMFPSPTKANAIPMARDTLASICRAVSLPVVAIGGITADNVSSLAGCGISGVAVVSAIFGQPDIEEAVRRLNNKLDFVLNPSASRPKATASETVTSVSRAKVSTSEAEAAAFRAKTPTSGTEAPAPLWLPSVLTIAGSDSGGGAGIQADLKTITAMGLYGSSAVTSITAQNTMGVQMAEPVSPALLDAQLESVLSDLPPQAIKLGMLGTAQAVSVVAEKLRAYKKSAPTCPIVLDPVMISTSGHSLLSEDGRRRMKELLFPLASLITPNLPEAEALLEGTPIQSPEEMERAAEAISRRFGVSVLLKGGHLSHAASEKAASEKAVSRKAAPEKAASEKAVSRKAALEKAVPPSVGDVLVQYHSAAGSPRWFMGPHVDNPNNHGTGCTLSSAIACGLARGLTMEESIRQARAYLEGALRAGLCLGRGNGPLHHGWSL